MEELEGRVVDLVAEDNFVLNKIIALISLEEATLRDQRMEGLLVVKDDLEVLKGDIDAESEGGGGDLFRNLSFTRSGSRLVCLALASCSC